MLLSVLDSAKEQYCSLQPVSKCAINHHVRYTQRLFSHLSVQQANNYISDHTFLGACIVMLILMSLVSWRILMRM